MYLPNMGAVYGPQLACCKSAEEAAASAQGTATPPCDPNCIGDDSAQRVLERMQAAIDANTQALWAQEAPAGNWISGVSNSTVVFAGIGLAAVLILRGRR